MKRILILLTALIALPVCGAEVEPRPVRDPLQINAIKSPDGTTDIEGSLSIKDEEVISKKDPTLDHPGVIISTFPTDADTLAEMLKFGFAGNDNYQPSLVVDGCESLTAGTGGNGHISIGGTSSHLFTRCSNSQLQITAGLSQGGGIALFRLNSMTGTPMVSSNLFEFKTLLVPFSADGGLELDRSPQAANYVATALDHLISVTDTTVPRTVTLPAAVDGQEIIVKDESGGAGTNNITIATPGIESIDGFASVAIATDHGWLSMYSDGTDWFITATSDPRPVPAHASSHSENQTDEIFAEDLGATSVDVSTALRPDGTGGVAFSDMDHVDLLNKGTNTHTQVDTHIADVTNPHTVTAAQVGNSTAQWNADEIQGVDVDPAAPADGELMIYDGVTDMRWEKILKANLTEIDSLDIDVTNVTTTSAAYVDITGATLTTTGSITKDYVFAWSTTWNISVVNQTGNFIFNIGGVDVPGSERHRQTGTGSANTSLSIVCATTTPLAPGTIVKVRYSTSGGTLTVEHGSIAIYGVGS